MNFSRRVGLQGRRVLHRGGNLNGRCNNNHHKFNHKNSYRQTGRLGETNVGLNRHLSSVRGNNGGVRLMSTNGNGNNSNHNRVVGGGGIDENVVKNGDRVQCHLIMRDSITKNVIIDSGRDTPVSFVVGQGQVIVGLEKRLVGMSVGDKWTETLGPQEAFGLRSDDRILQIPLGTEGRVPEVGEVVHLSDNTTGRVLEVNDGMLRVDTNHELAEKDIEFTIELMGIEEDTTRAWSGVQVQSLKPGDGENFPSPGDSVQVHYSGTLASNGQLFDKSQPGHPLAFTVGIGQVIRGWDEGLLQLSLGERARLFIASEFAYGAAGAGGGLIPPNENLIFDVELVSISKPKN